MYALWSDQNIKEIKEDQSFKRVGLLAGNMVISLLQEANTRHNAGMQKKDAEIDMLQVEIKTLKEKLNAIQI